VLQSRQRPWELQTRMSLQKFQKFEVLTGSSIRVQPAVGQASFGEPGLMKRVDVFSTTLLTFQAAPSEGSLSLSGLDLLRLICAKMGSTMAAVSIDASGSVSFFKRKLVKEQGRPVCHYLVSILWHLFVSLHDEMSDCSCSLIAVGTPPNPVGHTQK